LSADAASPCIAPANADAATAAAVAQGFYGKDGIPEEDAIKLIHRALELGVTLFNTSDLYGPYTNETMLGG
jgi:aryl-alcohol dehydrogenase-like predicted oxidoreductase